STLSSIAKVIWQLRIDPGRCALARPQAGVQVCRATSGRPEPRRRQDVRTRSRSAHRLRAGHRVAYGAAIERPRLMALFNRGEESLTFLRPDLAGARSRGESLEHKEHLHELGVVEVEGL